MRQLKFRCFDLLESKMHVGHSLSIGAGGTISFLDTTGQWVDYEDEDKVRVMQYTGRIDVMAHDIYEDDLLMDNNGIKFLVMWSARHSGWVIGANNTEIPFYKTDISNYRIIGNLHESNSDFLRISQKINSYSEHNQDSEWFRSNAEFKPVPQSNECSHDVILHDSRRNLYYIGFYCFPAKKWIETNTNNHLYNIERWRYFKK